MGGGPETCALGLPDLWVTPHCDSPLSLSGGRGQQVPAELGTVSQNPMARLSPEVTGLRSGGKEAPQPSGGGGDRGHTRAQHRAEGLFR